MLVIGAVHGDLPLREDGSGIAVHGDSFAAFGSAIRRTLRLRTSAQHGLPRSQLPPGPLVMLPISRSVKPPRNPGRFTSAKR
jgi:hypothetical protein